MKFFEKHWLQIIVATMLFLAFASWPYSYYQILRWAVSISAGLLAYSAYSSGKIKWQWIFIAVLILFNPIAPIYFERETWQLLDVIVGIVYLISISRLSAKKV